MPSATSSSRNEPSRLPAMMSQLDSLFQQILSCIQQEHSQAQDDINLERRQLESERKAIDRERMAFDLEREEFYRNVVGKEHRRFAGAHSSQNSERHTSPSPPAAHIANHSGRERTRPIQSGAVGALVPHLTSHPFGRSPSGNSGGTHPGGDVFSRLSNQQSLHTGPVREDLTPRRGSKAASAQRNTRKVGNKKELMPLENPRGPGHCIPITQKSRTAVTRSTSDRSRVQHVHSDSRHPRQQIRYNPTLIEDYEGSLVTSQPNTVRGTRTHYDPEPRSASARPLCIDDCKSTLDIEVTPPTSHKKSHPTTGIFSVWNARDRSSEPLCFLHHEALRRDLTSFLKEVHAHFGFSGPLPAVLYTPSGSVIRDMHAVKAGADYLVVPGDVAYHTQDGVPSALLSKMITDVQQNLT